MIIRFTEGKSLKAAAANNANVVKIVLKSFPCTITENTNNVILIKDSIELHVNTIIPLVKKITKITYPINYIHTDEDNNLNYLIQNTYEISKLDIKINNTENKIIIFNI